MSTLKDRLNNLLTSLDKLQKKYKMPVICSLHPRTKDEEKAVRD